MSSNRQDFDNPWKVILEVYFDKCLAFFFPEIHAEIDWSRGYECLNTELQQIDRTSELGKRWADKLAKVWRKEGSEAFVIIHAEVQGQPETVFGARMYTYYYRLGDKFKAPIVSVAILSDERPSWRPNGFETGLWGCEMSFRFPMVKLLDYEQRWEELEASQNVFATVVMAHLKAQATRGQPSERKVWKWSLTRRLYERGYKREEIINLYRFIDWVMQLPEELELEFQTELEQWEQEGRMPYLSTIERMARQAGREEGREEGERALILRQLARRFGAMSVQRQIRIEALALPQLEELGEVLLDFQSGEELDRWLDECGV
ncbi:DUF4351 domain-containing protein [Synechococcus sp. PCC 7336]|uniref:DUF4351 domain-containing protein n=1 Tax=Synechococcus sp. PCC 7336 TaxID=195250 RepID=UPI000347D228|nr:DUF4351 domain-containing protein [Synechococcus sp. PCC 7336]